MEVHSMKHEISVRTISDEGRSETFHDTLTFDEQQISNYETVGQAVWILAQLAATDADATQDSDNRSEPPLTNDDSSADRVQPTERQTIDRAENFSREGEVAP